MFCYWLFIDSISHPSSKRTSISLTFDEIKTASIRWQTNKGSRQLSPLVKLLPDCKTWASVQPVSWSLISFRYGQVTILELYFWKRKQIYPAGVSLTHFHSWTRLGRIHPSKRHKSAHALHKQGLHMPICLYDLFGDAPRTCHELIHRNIYERDTAKCSSY